ncbi:hypothetical protein [Conyzicola nivalis]
MPLFRRFGRPGLLTDVTRAAVVGGTAPMIARAVERGAARPAAIEPGIAADRTATPDGPCSAETGEPHP